ncbi:hypothetical protein [Variovorax sp. V15]
MHAYIVKVIDAAGVFYGYTQIATSCAAAEGIAFERFGDLRLLSVRRST